MKHVVGVTTRRALPLLGKWALLPSFLLVSDSDARSNLSQDEKFRLLLWQKPTFVWEKTLLQSISKHIKGRTVSQQLFGSRPFRLSVRQQILARGVKRSKACIYRVFGPSHWLHFRQLRTTIATIKTKEWHGTCFCLLMHHCWVKLSLHLVPNQN